MHNGPKAKEKSIWDGKLMPSILRGSKSHNEKIKAAREIAQASVQINATSIEAIAAPVKEENILTLAEENAVNKAGLSTRAHALITELKKLDQEVTPKIETFTKPLKPVVPHSFLYADEVLEPSPPVSPTKRSQTQVLSPFSNAKRVARNSGVSLKDECRGVYTEQEMLERIGFLAEVTKKIRPN